MLLTTTITVRGVRGSSDLWSRDDEPPAEADVITGVGACIVNGLQQLNAETDGASDQFTLIVYDRTLDLNRFDHVVDESTALTYEVQTVWRRKSPSGGLDHTAATIRLARGAGPQ